MSGIDPVSLAVTGLTTLSSMQQAKSQAKAQASAQAAAYDALRNQILETRRIEERREKERLRRDLAAKRARFGAGGVGGGGSASAVLAGLTEASRQRLAEGRRLDALSLSRLGDASPSRSLFDDRLGLAAGLLDEIGSRVPLPSLFGPSPSARVLPGRRN